jgi:hypothetical protein
MQHAGGTRSDAVGWCNLAAQLQLSLNDFRKLSGIRIQGKEARNECGKAGDSDFARLQRIGKEIIHFPRSPLPTPPQIDDKTIER